MIEAQSAIQAPYFTPALGSNCYIGLAPGHFLDKILSLYFFLLQALFLLQQIEQLLPMKTVYFVAG